MAILKINNIEVAEPSSIDWTNQQWEGENAGRNANGVMIHDYIAHKDALDITWDKLTEEEFNKMFSLTRGKNFNLKYYEPYSATQVTKNMYAGDYKSTHYSSISGKNVWISFSVSFIEN